MRKFFLVMLCTVFFLNVNMVAFAESSSSSQHDEDCVNANADDRRYVTETVFEKPLITNLDLLYERAKSGITEYTLPNATAELIVTDLESGEAADIAELLTTTQVYRINRMSDNTLEIEGAVTTMATSPRTLSDQDGAITARVTSTIYFTETTCSCHGYKHYKLTRASGYFQLFDSTAAALTDRYGATAHMGTGCYGTANYLATMPSSNWSFHHYPPIGAPAVNTWAGLNLVGSTVMANLNTRGKTYHLEVNNGLVGVVQ